MGTPEGEVNAVEARGRVLAETAARVASRESPYDTEEYYAGMRALMDKEALATYGTTDTREISEILERRRLEADRAFVESTVIAETPEGRAAQTDLRTRMASPDYPRYIDGVRERFMRGEK